MKTGWMTAGLAAATVAVAGCKDTTGNTLQPTAGSIAFSYSGARTGSYTANGLLTHHNDTSFVKKSFAGGIKLTTSSGQTYVGLLAYMPITTNVGHEVIFVFPFVAAGQTLNLTDTCTSSSCPQGLVAFDVNPDLVNDDSDPFFFTSGTLHITSTNNRRITGTFSGTAEDSVGARTITITNGEFDVPFEIQSAYPAGNRLIPSRAFSRVRKN